MDSFLSYCQARDPKIALKCALKMVLKLFIDIDMPDFKHVIVEVRLP
jgi:hypothetical protein